MPAWIQIEGTKQKHPMQNASNFCIGRNADCDLQLDDPKASRNHAIVQHTGQGYYLIDIASKNGCFLNSKRISRPSELKNGDQFRIGDTKFVFSEEVTNGDKEIDLNQTMLITEKTTKLDIQEITILVADIRGFTSLTESLSIEHLSGIMNQWFSEVTDCIEKHGGILDKFIGDSVYARWHKHDDIDPVLLALKASSDLNKISSGISELFPIIPFPLNIGVGINTGHAALDIGVEGTAMGDAVNLAFRLEDQSKIIGKNIVISEDSCRHLKATQWDNSDHAMQIFVKGKSDPIDIIGVSFDELDEYLNSLDT